MRDFCQLKHVASFSRTIYNLRSARKYPAPAETVANITNFCIDVPNMILVRDLEATSDS